MVEMETIGESVEFRSRGIVVDAFCELYNDLNQRFSVSNRCVETCFAHALVVRHDFDLHLGSARQRGDLHG